MTSTSDARPRGLRHRVRSLGGIVLDVRECGDPSGSERLLVPGVAQNYLSFVKHNAPPAWQRCRVVAFDSRSQGLSDQPLGDEWYRESHRWSGDVLAVIEATGLRRPVLARWSLGSRVVRQYLVDYSDACLAGVAFISCRPVDSPDVIGPGNAVTAALDIDDAAGRIDIAPAILRNCFAIQPAQAGHAFALACNMLCPWEVRLKIGGWLTDTRISETARWQVTAATFLVHGMHDLWVVPCAAALAAQLISHATVHWYQDCDHSVFFQAPERFNRDLGAFIARARHADAYQQDPARRIVATGRLTASFGASGQ